MTPRTGCRRHQDALLDFVDRRSAGPDVAAALAHLDRCRDCERDLAATAVVLAGLHRLWEETIAADASADAWPRLRERIAAVPPSRHWRPGTITGLVAGAGLMLALLLPSGLRLAAQGQVVDTSPSSGQAVKPAGDMAWLPPEVQRLETADRALSASAPASTLDTGGESLPVRYVDNIRATVGQQTASGRPLSSGPPILAR